MPFEVGEQRHAQADPIDDRANCAGLLHEAVVGSAVVEADLAFRPNLAGTAVFGPGRWRFDRQQRRQFGIVHRQRDVGSTNPQGPRPRQHSA